MITKLSESPINWNFSPSLAKLAGIKSAALTGSIHEGPNLVSAITRDIPIEECYKWDTVVCVLVHNEAGLSDGYGLLFGQKVY